MVEERQNTKEGRGDRIGVAANVVGRAWWFRFPGVCKDGISIMERTRTTAEKTILEFIKETPKAMYDIGVGIYAEWETLKLAFPSMEVFGCEPHPGEFQVLEPIYTGMLWQIGVGETSGKKILYLSETSEGRSSLLPYTGGNIAEVDIVTLDEFDAMAGKPDKILLWMDIEGGELSALKGGTELLSSGRVEWINLETRNWVPQNFVDMGYPVTSQIDEYLAKFGYVHTLRYNIQGITAPDSPAPGDVIYLKSLTT